MKTKKINLNIQFLRGVSVIIVFFFHFNTQIFNVFFVGVDIFFLLSGFVITNSIFGKENFNIFNYFLRRIKKIYPNLITILFIFFVIFFYFYKDYTDDYINNFFSIIFSLFGLSNIYYSLNPHLLYFNEEIRWILHTWSLSIEIQYYILFGLFSLIIFNLKKNQNVNIKLTKNIITFITIISFLLFVFTDIKYISDYYSLPARLWEFMLGSFLCFVYFEKKYAFNKIFIIFLIFLSALNFLTLDYKLIIVITLLLTFLILLHSKELQLNIITKPIIFIGKISYSFYLWHLIFISVFKNYFSLEIINFLIIFSITIVSSYFTYELIEARFNKKFSIDNYLEKLIKIFSILLIISFTYLSLFNSNYLYIINNKLNKFSINLFKHIDKNRFANSKQDNNKIILIKYDNCEKNYENFSWTTKVNCLKENSSDNLIYLFGNSYGEHLFPALHDIPSVNVIYSRFENEYLSEKNHSESKLNIIINQYKAISQKFINKIILISLNTETFSVEKIQNFASKINSKNTKIILLYPHPSIVQFKDKDALQKYNERKNNNFKKLSKINEILVFDTFDFICKKCNLDFYSKIFENKAHFNLIGSLKLTKPINEVAKIN